MRMLQSFVLITLALACAACASVGNLATVYRQPDLRDGRSVILDAAQYGILNIPDPDNPRHGRRIVCAMPSPDAIAAAAARGQLGVDNPGGTGGSIGVSIGSSVGSIGLRTQSIQLLRDAMYRTCEAYAAGGIDALEYGVMMRRFQSQLIAILAVEQLTGPVQAASPQNVSVNIGELDTGSSHQKDSGQDNTNTGATSPTTTTTPTATSTPQSLTADRKPRSATSAKAKAADGGTTTTTTTVVAPVPAPAPAADANKTAHTTADTQDNSDTQHAALDPATVHAVESITLAAMNTDYNSQMCFEMIRNSLLQEQLAPSVRADIEVYGLANRTPGAQETTKKPSDDADAAHRFNNYCLALMEADTQARTQVQRTIATLIDRLADPNTRIDVERINAIRSLLAELDQGWSSADLRDFSADRGPAGPAGPRGPAGPAGPRGARGTRGAAAPHAPTAPATPTPTTPPPH